MKRHVPKLQGNAKDVAKGELIGLRCRIAAAPDAGIIGLVGNVIGETLHTLELRIGGPGGRRVQLAKVGTTFAFTTDGGVVEVPGAAIEYRPWDRTKKVK